MVTLRFPKKFGPVEVYKVRQLVKTECRTAGLSPEATYAFVSAVDELCCNVMEHSDAEWFEVGLGHDGGVVRAVLKDNGAEFDPTVQIDESDMSVFQNASDRSLGLSMVGFMVDDIAHSRDEKGVNEVILTKKI